jgi:hypothetical protein
MHSALPLFEWRTPPGRAALREELRRCDAALRAVKARALRAREPHACWRLVR